MTASSRPERERFVKAIGSFLPGRLTAEVAAAVAAGAETADQRTRWRHEAGVRAEQLRADSRADIRETI